MNWIKRYFQKDSSKALKEAEEKLLLHQNRFRSLIENSLDGIVILSEQGKSLYISPSINRILGYSEEDALQTDIFALSHPDDLPEVHHLLERVARDRDGSVHVFTGRMQEKNGEWRRLEAKVRNLLHDPSVRGIVANFTDVTENRLAAEKLMQANRLYAFLSQINKTIVHSNDEQTIFKEACRIAMEYGGLEIAWVGAFDKQTLKVHVVESTGLGREEVALFEQIPHHPTEPQHQVLNGAKYFVCNNIQQSDLTRWKKVAKERNIHSFVIFPVKKSGQVYATFNLYSSKIDFFTDQEIALLDEAAEDMSFALDVLEKDKQRLEAEAAVRESEKALKEVVGFNQSLIEAAPIGIASFNANTGKCLSVNATFAAMVGAKEEELMDMNFREIASWQEFGLLRDASQTITTGEVIQKEIFFKSTFGNEKWINYRFVRFYDKDVPHLLLLMNDITERIHAEEALKKSEFQFRQIVETAQEGIWLIDDKFSTLFVNKKMCEMLGYTFEEMKGRSVLHFMEAQMKEKAEESIGVPGELSTHENVTFLTKNGNRIITMLNSTQFFDDEGKFTGALAMVADITEKARLEDLLFRTNRISSIGNYEIDLVNEKVYWSDIMREIMEVAPDFVPDLSTTNTFYREGQSNVLINQKVRDLIEEGVPYDEELQIVTQKGRVKWVRTIGEAEFFDGKCLRIYGSFQDIDEKKKSQREVLRVYEEKNDILESIADAFYAVDKNWMVTYWNKEAENLLQRNRKEMIGKNLWEAYPGLVGSDLYRHYLKVAKEGQGQQFVMYYDPVKRWFDISVYPSSNGISVYFKDVTENKESEIRLQELNKNLENYTKELVISNKNLEQFSYIVSHNLRTPVANILGLSRILKENGLDDDQKEYVIGELSSSVEALDEVIMDLNLVLKKKQEINESKEEVLFSRLVSNIKNSISGLIQSENVEIICDFSKVDKYFTIKSYLHSVFYNLISNSIKYRFPGRHPVIVITSQRKNGKIVLSFEDNGSGIDLEKKRDQIFGLYKRFHTNIEGKGMGLFMVKTQVEALGGEINVRSRPNHGTIFEMEFPDNKPNAET